MGSWQIPAGMTGDPSLLRVSSKMARLDTHACPASLATKARPGIRPLVRPRRSTLGRPDFTFGPFMVALDLIEHDHLPLQAALAQAAEAEGRGLPPHTGLMEWTSQAVERYSTAAAGMSRALDGVTLEPCPHPWVYRWAGRGPQIPSRGDPAVYEITVWGRGYRSSDGKVRELRLPRLGAAGDRDRDAAEVAVAAFVVAYGGPASKPRPWSEPYPMMPCDDLVERVRIIEYGCADASTRVLFSGTSAEAEADYRDLGQARLHATTDGGPARPGDSCAKCKLLTSCSTLPRVPGLLGIPDSVQPLRTWSATNGRDYGECPAKEHLRRLHLPRADEYDDAARRGLAVHARLAELHARTPRVPCSEHDLRADPSGWQAGRWALTGEQAALGASQLAHHLPMCPLASPAVADGPAESVLPEHRVAAHDTQADVIVVATPDLLYLDSGSWVWRETKTTASSVAREHDVLRKYPQIALGTLLLAAGVLGGDPAASRVELEILRPNGADPYLVDPNDPGDVAHARAVVHDLAQPWHRDQRYDPRPGPYCATCEVALWCPAAMTGAGAAQQASLESPRIADGTSTVRGILVGEVA
jgi:PD-(D/E)XK nuclease superfamily